MLNSEFLVLPFFIQLFQRFPRFYLSGTVLSTTCRDNLKEMIYTGFSFTDQPVANCMKICRKYALKSEKHQIKSIALYQETFCFCSKQAALQIGVQRRDIQCTNTRCHLIKEISCQEGISTIYTAVDIALDPDEKKDRPNLREQPDPVDMNKGNRFW